MSFPLQGLLNSSSPVAAAFPSLCWNPLVLDRCSLSDEEKAVLRSNTWSECVGKSCAYIRVLLKMLEESSSSPSSQVSKLKEGETLSESEALRILYMDTLGVVTHYAVSQLFDLITCFKEAKSSVSILDAFYNHDTVTLCHDLRPLMRVLHLEGDGDAFAQRLAALCLAHILTAGCPSQRTNKNFSPVSLSRDIEEKLNELLSWIAYQLVSSAPSVSLSIVMPALKLVMNCPEARYVFADCGGIGCMAQCIKYIQQTPPRRTSFSGVQHLYELTFCMWCMTYDCDDHPSTAIRFCRDGAVPALVDMVAAAPREKVVRVALASLRNLALHNKALLQEMMDYGLSRYVDNLRQNQVWTDPDMVDDLRVLHKLLHENYQQQSQWHLYRTEVESGRLEWNITHTSKFLREHVRKFEEDDFSLFKKLIKLVLSEDEDVVAIACFDIGEFVRHYPNGRAIAKSLGAHLMIMPLIEHKNPEVQRHALQAMSKILTNHWEDIT